MNCLVSKIFSQFFKGKSVNGGGIFSFCCVDHLGLLLGLSKCFKSFGAIKIDDGKTETALYRFIEDLLCLVNDISSTMIQLLAGTYAKGARADNNSPSFADMDKAINVTLECCPSYCEFRKEFGILYCRELISSFCWLNLKSITLILNELGNLSNIFRSKLAILSLQDLQVICELYEKTLVKCRHKGVIEASYASLTYFAKKTSSVTSFWNYLQGWCLKVLHSAINLKQRASVTKRRYVNSAGLE